MNIPSKSFSTWKKLQEHGDYEKIAQSAGTHYQTISRAFKDKKCKASLFNKIDAFYKNRQKSITETENDNN